MEKQQPNRSGYNAKPSTSQIGRNPDHRDAMKEMMKKMMDPSKQSHQPPRPEGGQDKEGEQP